MIDGIETARSPWWLVNSTSGGVIVVAFGLCDTSDARDTLYPSETHLQLGEPEIFRANPVEHFCKMFFLSEQFESSTLNAGETC